MFFNRTDEAATLLNNMWRDETGVTNTSEIVFAVTTALLVLSVSYLYQTETEALRTGALVMILLTVTTVSALNYNVYLALTLLIAEVGAVTALTLLQQAYYATRILNVAPILALVAYPVYKQANTYFKSTDCLSYSYVNKAEAASELYKALTSPSDPYTPTLLVLLTWGSIFIAVLISSMSNWTELKSQKNVYKKIRTDRLVVFKKVTNETRSKLLLTNVVIC